MPRKMSGGKRMAYWTGKIGTVPAETSGRVKGKSQRCDDHHRFEIVLDSRGSCVLRRILPGGRLTGVSNRVANVKISVEPY